MSVVSIFIYVVISFVVAYGLIGISLDMIDFAVLSQYIQTHFLKNMITRIILCAAGFLVALVPLLGLLSSFFNRARREKTIQYETDTGLIQVTLSALEDMVKKCVQEIDLISHIRPKVISHKKFVIIFVRVVLKSEVNVKTFAEEIQSRVKNKIEAILGQEKQLKINVQVRKIAFTAKENNFDEEGEEEVEGPFRKY